MSLCIDSLLKSLSAVVLILQFIIALVSKIRLRQNFELAKYFSFFVAGYDKYSFELGVKQLLPFGYAYDPCGNVKTLSAKLHAT
jgi:hypothetical protein